MRPDLRRGVAVAVLAIAACSLGIASTGAWTLWLAPALTMALAATVLRFGVIARRHEQLVADLRARSTVSQEAGLRVRTGAFSGAVFVGGFRRPEIFMDEAVRDTLSLNERRAVLLHEQSHLHRRDPLRMSIESAVRPLADRTAWGRTWLIEREAAREIRADRYALDHGASVQAIAAALLKVHPIRSDLPGFTSSVVDHRIAALTGEPLPQPRRFELLTLPAALLAAAALCFNAMQLARIMCCP